MAVLLSILSLEWTEIRFENNQKKNTVINKLL